MRDFNFFEVFEEKTKRKKGSRISYPNILILILAAAALWPAWNYFQLNRLESSIESHRTALETDPRYPLFEVAVEKEQELEEARETLVQMEKSADIIYDREVIDELLLFAIATAMPEDTSLNYMSINDRNVQVTGVARSKPAIAEFEHNIRQTGYFENIFIPSISESEDLWRFNMAFSVMGGDGQ